MKIEFHNNKIMKIIKMDLVLYHRKWWDNFWKEKDIKPFSLVYVTGFSMFSKNWRSMNPNGNFVEMCNKWKLLKNKGREMWEIYAELEYIHNIIKYNKKRKRFIKKYPDLQPPPSWKRIAQIQISFNNIFS